MTQPQPRREQHPVSSYGDGGLWNAASVNEYAHVVECSEL